MAYKTFKKTEIIDELGTELRKNRNLKGLTLIQVADALTLKGIHISSIMLGRIETGQRRIDDTLLHALCDYYQIDPNEIIIKACKNHISSIQARTTLPVSDEDDSLWIIEAYHNLPANRQADVRTMIRMLSYMDQFSKLDS